MFNNPEWKRMYSSLISVVVFGLVLVGALGFMDGISGEYAVAFVAFFLMASGIVVAGFFFTSRTGHGCHHNKPREEETAVGAVRALDGREI